VRNRGKVLLAGCLQTLAILSAASQDDWQIKSLLRDYPGVYSNPDGYINGRRNSFVYPVASGNPYYMRAGQAHPVLETVYGTYDSLLLKYDLLNDELILGFRNGDVIEEIMVNRNIVLSFSLYGVRFVHLKNGAVPVPGYYEEVYNSGIRCYIKHIKSLAGTAGTAGYEYRYGTRILLLNDGQSYNIKNNKTLLNALEDKHKEMKSFLQKNHILVRYAIAGELIRVLKFYESLQP